MRFEAVRDGRERIQVMTEDETLLFKHKVVSRGNSLLCGGKRVKTVIYHV